MEIKILINGKDYSKYATLPVQTQDTIDESLDIAYIKLVGLPDNTPLTPFGDVEAEITDKKGNKKVFNMFVQNDTSTEIISKKKSNHDVLLIEQTKWLERFYVEKTVRQPLYHDYIKGAELQGFNILQNGKYEGANQVKENATVKFWSPQKIGSIITTPDFEEIFAKRYYTSLYSVRDTLTIKKDDEIIYTDRKLGRGENKYVSPTHTFALEEGIYTINMKTDLVSNGNHYVGEIEYIIAGIQATEKVADYTLKDVIDILLTTTETLKENETPRFALADIDDYNESEEYKENVSKILAMKSPEFTFSKQSLYEALKQIGDYAHFLPRLKNGKIYLDLLGQREFSTISQQEYISNVQTQNIEQFCDKLDSQVNNLVNMDDENAGSIIEPYRTSYRTLRTVSGVVRITDENIIIPTDYPIEKIIKLELGYLSDGTYIGDITPYVYESAEYQALDSYTASYPYAKMFALKYTQGQNNITELTFKRPNAVNTTFESIAIKNIIYRKLGKTINWWNSLWNTENPIKLQYRITYIPSTDTRVTQSKAYKNDITGKDIAIAYNQSASKVSSNAYGENLKGTIAKYGNVEINKMYLLPSVDLIPKVGQLYDKDYYIAVVKSEYYPNFIKCEVGLSKNYNNKSAYVEINSQLRFYEISERMTQDRYVIYEEYCEIGDAIKTDGNSSITRYGLYMFGRTFTDKFSNVLSNIDVIPTGFAVSQIADKKFNLPVISLSIGNSLLFSYKFADNYSAGSIVEDGNNQQDVRYADIIGRIDSINVTLGTNASEIDNYEEAVKNGDNELVANANVLEYFEIKGLKLYKDSAEKIHITTQLHMVSNKENLVIGSGLTNRNALVTTDTNVCDIYILDNELNKLDSTINLTNAHKCATTITASTNESNKSIALGNFTADHDGKAYVIMSGDALILGENLEIHNGDVVELPNLTFKRRIK